MFDEDNRIDVLGAIQRSIDESESSSLFNDLFNKAKNEPVQSQSKYIGDSRQRWSEVESGHHRDARGRMIKAGVISERYAQNMRNWYITKIDMTPSERERLEDSELFQILNKKIGIETTINHTNKIKEGDMITMFKEEKVATIKSLVTNTTETTLVGKSEAKVGDIVLTKEGSEGKFGSFNIGRVETIEETDQVRRGVSKITDIVTDASEDFKVLSNELRKKAIKAEIEERMKKVDERQRMQMYAKEDDNIKELLSQLDNL